MQSMLPALERHALRGELEVRKAALLGLEAVGCHAVLLEIGHFEGTVSGLLTCCCDTSREVRRRCNYNCLTVNVAVFSSLCASCSARVRQCKVIH